METKIRYILGDDLTNYKSLKGSLFTIEYYDDMLGPSRFMWILPEPIKDLTMLDPSSIDYTKLPTEPLSIPMILVDIICNPYHSRNIFILYVLTPEYGPAMLLRYKTKAASMGVKILCESEGYG